MLTALCGDAGLRRLFLVASKSEYVEDENAVAAKERMLREKDWKYLIGGGATMTRWDLDTSTEGAIFPTPASHGNPVAPLSKITIKGGTGAQRVVDAILKKAEDEISQNNHLAPLQFQEELPRDAEVRKTSLGKLLTN